MRLAPGDQGCERTEISKVRVDQAAATLIAGRQKTPVLTAEGAQRDNSDRRRAAVQCFGIAVDLVGNPLPAFLDLAESPLTRRRTSHSRGECPKAQFRARIEPHAVQTEDVLAGFQT
jgi:hypothetical protein